MKKWMAGLMMVLMLTGCGAEETMETISDDICAPAAVPGKINVRLPDNAVAPVLESDTEQVYFSEDYEIVIETRPAGDLGGTITALSGFAPETLTIMHTCPDGVERYEFVWVSAGESGDRLGRAVILDDGNYHYCMTVLRDGEKPEMSQIVWQDVFSSFCVVPGESR